MALGQTEIFQPEPTRRLIVPPQATCWWGTDPGSQRVAIASIDEDGDRRVDMASFPRLEGGERLAAIYAETRRLACELAKVREPGIVVVEQPSGKQPNPALSYAVGAIMAGLSAGVRETFPDNHVAVVTVSSSTWKKVSTGSGAAWKPKSGKIEEYAVYQWARDVAGYRGRSFDEVDAHGIAEYACRTYGLDPR